MQLLNSLAAIQTDISDMTEGKINYSVALSMTGMLARAKILLMLAVRGIITFDFGAIYRKKCC